jgi:hypothetical protein
MPPNSKLKKAARTRVDQSARFIEAAKAAGADQKDFERAFKKIVKPKRPTKKPNR